MRSHLFISLWGGILMCINSHGQVSQEYPKDQVFLDTLCLFAVDSLEHRIGFWSIADTMPYLYKSFKYLGPKSMHILKPWTQDPFFICNYPQEPLIPGMVYKIKICMTAHPGIFRKRLGFNFEDGCSVPFVISGEFTLKD